MKKYQKIYELTAELAIEAATFYQNGLITTKDAEEIYMSIVTLRTAASDYDDKKTN